MAKDYYETLGLNKSDSKDAIKKAYRKLAFKYHPDKATDKNKKSYEEEFKKINEAYDVLGNDSKKQQYDSHGHDAFNQKQSYGGGGATREDFSDMFEDLFRNSGFGNRSEYSDYGEDLQYELTIDFMEAVNGVEKEISIKKDVLCEECDGTGAQDKKISSCDKCDGRGRVVNNIRTPFGVFRQEAVCDKCRGEGKIPKHKCKECNGKGIINKRENMKVNIPRGIDNGQTLRVRGAGNAMRNRRKMDLFLVISVKPHKVFKRDGDDISMDLEISFSQAALGCEISIPTLSKDKKIKIVPGTESEIILRLKGQGIHSVNGYHVGDQFVVVKVKTPSKLSKKQVKLFEELAKLDGNKWWRI